MKKIISALLAAALLLTIASCGKKSNGLRFGLGVRACFSAAENAKSGKDGEGAAIITCAAVLSDKNGRIIECELDAAELSASFTSDGGFVKIGELRTKGELGDEYGMKGASAAGKEWHEQAEAFEDAAEGKTVEQIKARLATGESEIVTAGCTIDTSDFIAAVEAAVASSRVVEGGVDADVELGASSVLASSRSASEDADGKAVIETGLTAALKDDSGRASAIFTDCVEVSFVFDRHGVCAFERGGLIPTKKSLADSYGMARYGTDRNGDGSVKEWYLQAEEFEGYCLGKTAEEIALSMGDDGYGIDELQRAGCTISVSLFVRSAVKALE